MAKDVVFKLEDVPDEHETEEQQITYLQGEIKETAKDFNKEGKAAVESAVRLGCMLNVLKELVNGQKKGSWEKYRDTELTYVNKRTGQRCMALARSLGPVLEKSAKLSWAGKTRLLKLAKLAKKLGKDVGDLLEDSEVALDFDHKKVKKVKAFHDQIDKLLKEVKAPKEKKEKGLKATVLRMKKAATTWAEDLKASKSDGDLLDGIKPETIQETIHKFEKLLNQLSKAKKRITGEDSDREAA
jgi:hypothetical protein